MLSAAGELNNDNTLVLVTVTVPSDLTKMTVNLQGPIVVNVDERKACQIIIDNGDYPVKYPIYDILQAGKEGE
jgi:flagellar assembly factor FliW